MAKAIFEERVRRLHDTPCVFSCVFVLTLRMSQGTNVATNPMKTPMGTME